MHKLEAIAMIFVSSCIAATVGVGVSGQAQQAEAPRIAPEDLTYKIVWCSTTDSRGQNNLHVTVSRKYELGLRAVADEMFTISRKWLFEKCPPRGNTTIYLMYDDDPRTSESSCRYWKLEDCSDRRSPAEDRYERETERRIREAAQQEVAEQRRQQQEQTARAEQAVIAARTAGFVKANGVRRHVTSNDLAANPFVYQGQIVAIFGVFEQMNSATQGLFSSGQNHFVVSGVPASRFTRRGSSVVLAGRVLGNVEIKLPVFGATLVPNLAFVGSAFCNAEGCSDYDFRLR